MLHPQQACRAYQRNWPHSPGCGAALSRGTETNLLPRSVCPLDCALRLGLHHGTAIKGGAEVSIEA